MALLRITSPEQLKAHAPGELGLLLGLDRAPQVKTVRRKLHEIGARKLSRTLADTFARRWAQAEPEALGYLYIDGHVRPYHGRRHRIPKTFVQRRRRCMPATTEVWVNDARAQPWFFVTTEANDHLLAAIERDILAPLRKEVGAQRRVTLVFDREGWSPKAFARWAAAGFDVMTYRKGRYDPWPEDAFVAVVDPTPTRGGKPMTWRLAERETDLGAGRGRPVFRMREVRRLCDNGHQTSIMTTRRDLATPQVASRMFARWRQENFFRYMGLPRFSGRLRAVVTGTEVNDSRWKGIFLGDRCWGSPHRVVVDPRPTAPEGLLGGLFAMTLGAHRAPPRGRATFEFVGALVPQRGVQSAGVVPGFEEREDGHARFGMGPE